MLDFLVILFTIYFILKMYIAIMQIGYITTQRKNSAVILPASKYIKAANYAISVQKLSLLEYILEYIMFIFWLNFGFAWLDNIIGNEIDYIYKSIIFVLEFLAIGYLVNLPFSIYKTFYLDKKYNFSKITPKLYIIDTIKSIILTLIIGTIIIGVLTLIIQNYTNWW